MAGVWKPTNFLACIGVMHMNTQWTTSPVESWYKYILRSHAYHTGSVRLYMQTVSLVVDWSWWKIHQHKPNLWQWIDFPPQKILKCIRSKCSFCLHVSTEFPGRSSNSLKFTSTIIVTNKSISHNKCLLVSVCVECGLLLLHCWWCC